MTMQCILLLDIIVINNKYTKYSHIIHLEVYEAHVYYLINQVVIARMVM